MSPDHLLF